jgi:hypothetical protein
LEPSALAHLVVERSTTQAAAAASSSQGLEHKPTGLTFNAPRGYTTCGLDAGRIG